MLVERYREELEQICAKHNLLLDEEVLSKRRDRYIRAWRVECYAYLKNKGLTYKRIWDIFNKTHTAIIYSLNRHCKYKNLLKY